MATAKKKPVNKKSSKKSVAAKSSNKAATKKTALKNVKTTKKTKPDRFELLRRFHFFSAAVSVLIAAAALFVLNDQSVSFTSSFSDKDPIASNENVVLGTATESLVTVELKYLVAKLFAISAVLSLLLATLLRSRYEAGVKNSTSAIRWIFTGITAGLMVKLVAVLAGVQDVATLALIGSAILTTAVLGWIVEREIKASGVGRWSTYSLSLFTGVVAWLPTIFALAGTHLFGLERYGWQVYALIFVISFACVRFAVTQAAFIKAGKTDYLPFEEKYISNDMFMKLAFAAIVFIAFSG